MRSAPTHISVIVSVTESTIASIFFLIVLTSFFMILSMFSFNDLITPCRVRDLIFLRGSFSDRFLMSSIRALAVSINVNRPSILVKMLPN